MVDGVLKSPNLQISMQMNPKDHRYKLWNCLKNSSFKNTLSENEETKVACKTWIVSASAVAEVIND